jgi:DNA-binding HxlR family transcriptional regulator
MENIQNVDFRSICPIATGLDIIGDKWTLLILRDMLWGHKSMFNEFRESIEHIPSKMLSNRLKKLEGLDYISKNKGQINKKNIYYFLKDKGLETAPIMIEIGLFTTNNYIDHLGEAYTKDLKKNKKNKEYYTLELIKKYNTFKNTIQF